MFIQISSFTDPQAHPLIKTAREHKEKLAIPLVASMFIFAWAFDHLTQLQPPLMPQIPPTNVEEIALAPSFSLIGVVSLIFTATISTTYFQYNRCLCSIASMRG